MVVTQGFVGSSVVVLRGGGFERSRIGLWRCGEARAQKRVLRLKRSAASERMGLSGEPQATASKVAPWFQKRIVLTAKPRGCHVVTREVLQQLPELKQYQVGVAHFFLQHTSAALTINENASPDVPIDLETALNRVAPEGFELYTHNDEGSDDMPAHVKSSLVGCSLSIPISSGRLALGTWQGLYLCEPRNYGGARSVVVTLNGM